MVFYLLCTAAHSHSAYGYRLTYSQTSWLAGYGGVEKNDAGEWVGVQNTNVQYSICPKGWKLPLSGNNKDIEELNNNEKSGSFYNMLKQYGLESKVASADGKYNIAASPLYFVRSGYVNLNNGSLRTFGLNGYGWSNTPVAYSSPTSATAYSLRFNASGVNPSYGPNNRWNGFPVRCLVY